MKTQISQKLNRRIDYSWDYKGEKIKSHTHGLHTYPAMFIPQVASRLLNKLSKKGDTVCDIFCGSGTTLVEARLSGRNAYGIDLNPLAIFIAKVKTTPIEPTLIKKQYFEITQRFYKKIGPKPERPNFNNLKFWFKDSVIDDLAKLKHLIKLIEDKNIQNFFLIAFSETVRRVSNTKNSEFKLVRMKKEKLEKHAPNVFDVFCKKLEENITYMEQYYHSYENDTWVNIIEGDSSKDNGIATESIDLILTSPPYGDSRTTVAYGQFSRLSSQWLDIFDDPNEASTIDKMLLGGARMKFAENELNSNYLTETIEKIKKRDIKRAEEVLSFFVGLKNSMKQAHRILKKEGYFAIVVGNRLVKQVRIPTDFIIAEISTDIGFKCEDIFVRNIPGKRMPLQTSPTNKTGVLENTMHKESIVILKKIR